MKTSEIKELTNKEILERLQTEKDSLLRMKMNHAISPLDSSVTHQGCKEKYCPPENHTASKGN